MGSRAERRPLPAAPHEPLRRLRPGSRTHRRPARRRRRRTRTTRRSRAASRGAGSAAQYVLGLDNIRSDGSSSLQRTAALTFTEQLQDALALRDVSGHLDQRATGFAAQRQLAVGVSRQLLGGTAAYQFSRNNVGAAAAGAWATATRSRSRTAGRSGRKLDAQLSRRSRSRITTVSPTSLIETTVSLVRRLSRVVALQVSGDVFRQTGIGGGSGTAFQCVAGRPVRLRPAAADDRPRATRTCRRSSAAPSRTRLLDAFAYNAPAPRGYNNALIILDGESRSAPTPRASSSSGSSPRARTRSGSTPPRSRRA